MPESVLTTLQRVLFPTAFAIGWLLEGIRPSRPWASPRLRHAGRNLTLWLLFLAVNTPLAAATSTLANLLYTRKVGALQLLPLSEGGHIIMGVLLLDLCLYATHVAKHRVAFLWRFHRVHHSDPFLDISSTYRFHPVDVAFTSAPILLLVGIFGIPPFSLLLYFLYLVAVEQFLHANLSWPKWLDRLTRAFVASPAVHCLHHAAEARYLNANYSEGLTLWDRLFGTYLAPDPENPPVAGLPGYSCEEDKDRFQSVKGMLMTPFQTK